MKKIFLLLCLFGLSFAKLNINTATEYELVKFGELDSEHARALIEYRQNKEITDISELDKVPGFKNYNISALAKTFDFVPATPVVVEKVIYRDRYVYPYQTRKVIRSYGDITITDTYHRQAVPPHHKIRKKAYSNPVLNKPARNEAQLRRKQNWENLYRNRENANRMKNQNFRNERKSPKPRQNTSRVSINGGFEYSYRQTR